MAANPLDKIPTRPERSASPRRHMSWGRHLLVAIAFVAVLAMIFVGVWVSVIAVNEKIQLVRGVNQIIDIVQLSRHLAAIDRALGSTDHEDILKRLERDGQIQTVGARAGLRLVANPWSGALLAFSGAPGNTIRLETTLPSRICVRVVEVLAKDIVPLGVQQIDTKGDGAAWRQIYVGGNQGRLGKNEIAAGCQSDQSVTLALTFVLR